MFVEHKEALEVTQAPAKITKLSEAIRIGCKLRPPVANTFAYFDNCGSCALGAAYQAITGRVNLNAEGSPGIVDTLSVKMGVPVAVLIEVCQRFHKRESREAIADHIAAKGY